MKKNSICINLLHLSQLTNFFGANIHYSILLFFGAKIFNTSTYTCLNQQTFLVQIYTAQFSNQKKFHQLFWCKNIQYTSKGVKFGNVCQYFIFNSYLGRVVSIEYLASKFVNAQRMELADPYFQTKTIMKIVLHYFLH